MPSTIRLFLAGLLISFAGALPLGTLNVSAMQIAVGEGVPPALQFALGALSVEVLYVRFSLTAMDWLKRNGRVLKYFEWVTLALVCALAVATFLTASPSADREASVVPASVPRGLLGVLMSAVNPLQIPFWFGWSAVLATRGVLVPGRANRNAYLLGIGAGSLMGFCVFIFGGQWLVSGLQVRRHSLQYAIAGAFAVTAMAQAWKMRSDASRRVRDKDVGG